LARFVGDIGAGYGVEGFGGEGIDRRFDGVDGAGGDEDLLDGGDPLGREVGAADGWFGVPAGNFYAWLFVTLAFSFLSRWLRDASARRSSLEWLQLAVPIPAFALLLVSLVPFTMLRPFVDPAPGGGLLLFLITLAAFVGAAAWGTFGPDRGRPDGSDTAILDLRLAFGTRVAIHLFFLAALFVLGLATSAPILLVVSVTLLAAELPLGAVVERRRSAMTT